MGLLRDIMSNSSQSATFVGMFPVCRVDDLFLLHIA